MSIENIDFDDLPEEEVKERVKTINVTVKLTPDVKAMFEKIAHRERYNLGTLGAIAVERYIENYIANYKASKE